MLAFASEAQNYNRVKKPEIMKNRMRKEVIIPDIPGYKTLKCDFHIHTAFSDGDVWPTIRVQEAYYDGLDAIAITDHIEYTPHSKDLPKNHNRPFEIAKSSADNYNILLVKGSEVTRKMPPGHINALFIEDANKLDVPDYMDAIEEANRQGAFLFWNHPGWIAQQPDTTLWWDVHEDLLKKGWLHGIEVFNYDEYYPVAFDWCNDKKMAYIGNSDIHDVVSHIYNNEQYNRPMTLVFAKEASLPAIKEALFEKRSVAFFGNEMAGPESLMLQLFEASVIFEKPFRVDDEMAYYEISNPTSLTFYLENMNPGKGTSSIIELLPGTSVIAQAKLTNGSANLQYKVKNLHIGTAKNLIVNLKYTH